MMKHPVDFVMEQEGGFVDDPKDPGGATKYGISLRFLKAVDPALADLDEDGDVDADDIRAMSPSQARYFYMGYFFGPMSIDRYPASVGAAVMDTAVNMGKARAARMLQQAVNDCGGNLKVDGDAGPVTTAAVIGIDPMMLVRAFLLRRVAAYADLCHKNKALNRFFFGWINRVIDLGKFASEINI